MLEKMLMKKLGKDFVVGIAGLAVEAIRAEAKR